MIELVPLKCPQCDTPIPADPKEIAWVCENCGQGLHLDGEEGLTGIEIRFAKSDSIGSLRCFPFWVVRGKVSITQRVTYTKNERPDPLWRSEQTFMLPAFECTLEQAVDWGTFLLRNPLTLVDGPKTEMESISIEREDMQALAEFVVLTIEAERKDKLEQLKFNLDLEQPELWVIPFKLEGENLHLAITR